MKRIATPMMGGVVTSTLMELLVDPAIYYLWRSRRFQNQGLTVAPAGRKLVREEMLPPKTPIPE